MAERILYGVQGEGRGHASRSLQVIQWLLSRGYRVKVLTGGDALAVLGGMGLDLEEIPMIRYQFRPDGSFSPWLTFVRNVKRALGLLLGVGEARNRVARIAAAFRPDLIISDFEPYLSRTAGSMGIPLLAIDHQHFLTESVLPRVSGFQNLIMLKIHQLGTSLMAGRPDRIITSSFYHFPKKRDSRAVFVGPFIPVRLKGPPAECDGSITVYLKQPAYLRELSRIMARRPETRFVVFSDWRVHAPGPLPGNVRLAPIGREEFLEQLAKGKALISTAGNQVIGEAVYLRKPVLAFPEPDVLEQELNASALRLSGFGDSFRLEDFSERDWDAFERKLPEFRERMIRLSGTLRAMDGRKQALRAVRGFLRDISAPSGQAAHTGPGRARSGAASRIAFAR
jgi:uncharacterized protein (TIGR00661 family)